MHRNDLHHLEQEKILGVMNFRRFRLSERIILVTCQCHGELPDVRLKTSRSFKDIREGETYRVTLPGGGAFLGRGRIGKPALDQTIELAKRLEISRFGLCAHAPCIFAEASSILDILWRLRQAHQRILRIHPHFEISPCFAAHRPLQGFFTHWVDLKALEDYRAKTLAAA